MRWGWRRSRSSKPFAGGSSDSRRGCLPNRPGDRSPPRKSGRPLRRARHGPLGRAGGEVRRRLDAEMVRRGLATNRTEASRAIRSGRVMVAGRLAAKAGTLILPEEPIVLSAPARKFVSRAGEKLEAALID